MPIYEFYCDACHRVFSFLARSASVDRKPDCPRCGKTRLEKRPSRFAVTRGLAPPDVAGPDGLDDAALERALASMGGELDGLDDEDPRQAARLMRKLYDATGISAGPAIEEAIRRMEAGEDPDRIDDDLGDVLDDEAQGAAGVRALARRVLPPSVDETLYEL